MNLPIRLVVGALVLTTTAYATRTANATVVSEAAQGEPFEYRTASLATTGAGASAQSAETETPIPVIPFTGTARRCRAVSSSSSLNVPTRTQRWQP